MRSRVSENGRERITASCARRTFAAATSFIAEVIFFVFFTLVTRSRSSLTLGPMETAARRDCTPDTGAPWKPAATDTAQAAKTTMVPRIAKRRSEILAWAWRISRCEGHPCKTNAYALATCREGKKRTVVHQSTCGRSFRSLFVWVGRHSLR